MELNAILFVLWMMNGWKGEEDKKVFSFTKLNGAGF